MRSELFEAAQMSGLVVLSAWIGDANAYGELLSHLRSP
jgi:hypothetical protein